MIKVCSFCGNKNFRQRSVQYIYKHDNKFLLVNEVPCEKCEYCGEQYFEAKVLKEIEQIFMDIHFAGKETRKTIQVPVTEFEGHGTELKIQAA
ncbi:MAG TPA: type II toxin-antitoxin system MqsA family antitoxin [Chloroflexi bacterium]|nr:type II toxin-antitoxin system MqsA family antitoxin [Chloroflexota bacterium]